MAGAAAGRALNAACSWGSQVVWRCGSRVLGSAATATVVFVATACAVLPDRQPPPPPVPAAQVAQSVTMVGLQGAVSSATGARDLAQAKAEGKGDLLQRQLGVLAAQGEQNLYRGNSARLLIDGPATFAAMKSAIAAARERIFVEFYIVEDTGVAAEIGELLLSKAAAGLSVALLYDSVGSMGTSKAFFDNLQAGGVKVCAYNPVNPLERPGRWGLLQRNHRKMLAVDSDVAYTGGINLSNVYAEGSFGSGRSKPRNTSTGSEGWRDTQVELRGPVVTAMAVLFRETWATQACHGELPVAGQLATPVAIRTPSQQGQSPGQRIVKLVAGDPQQGVNPTYTTLMGAIGAAQRSVHLTMAYFAPGPELVRALADAARRGVDVSLVLPGRSDVTLVLHAARSYYTQLLEAGVQIHEMQHAVMHAKTAVVDGVLSSVGSSNLDWRSIVGNTEIDVIVLGDDFGRQLEDQFRRDVAISQRIDPGNWQQRGMGRRLLERFSRLIEPML